MKECAVDERRYVSISEFAAATGVPRTTVASWCQRGVLRSRRIGRRVLIEACELSAQATPAVVNGGNIGGAALEARRFLASIGERDGGKRVR